MRALHTLCTLLLISLPVVATAKPSPRGRALEQLADGRIDAAAQELRRAVKSDPDPDLRCLLGHILRRAGKNPEAISVLASVAKTAACHRQAVLTRADALRASGRIKEAAELYETYGAQALGPHRELPIARWLLGLSATARKTGAHARANQLLGLALDRDAPAEVLAELMPWPVIADRALEGGLNSGLKTKAANLLLAQLRNTKSGKKKDSLRLSLAPLLDGTQRVDVLKDVEGEAAERLRIRFLLGIDLDAAARRLKNRDGRVAELVSKAATSHNRHDLAIPILQRLIHRESPTGRDASRQLSKSLAALGRRAEAISALKNHLRRFKRDPNRATIEAEADKLAMQIAAGLAEQGKIEAARTAYLAISESSRSRTAAQANLEAATLALAAKDWKTARSELRDTISRWPQSPAGRAAASALAFEYAQRGELDSLKRLTKVRTELKSQVRDYDKVTTLSVTAQRQTPGKDAHVQVRLRNVDSIEAKLHRIDSAAFFGAGLDPERLADLDVAVVAPDRQWTVPVPKHRPHTQMSFDLKISKPKAGLYRLTLSGGTKEASVVLVVSDLDILLQGVGRKLLIVAARRGRPVLGVKVRARVADKLVFAKTTHLGIAQLDLPPGPVTIWAEHNGSVALAAMQDRGSSIETAKKAATVELDRAVYSPGDLVRFAIQGFHGLAPMAGNMKVWLVVGEHAQPPVTVKLGASGFGSGQLRLPQLPQSGQRGFEIHGRLPGEESSSTLARATVAAEVSLNRRLQGWMHEQSAVLRVVDAKGRGVDQARVSWRAPGGAERQALTDASGRIVLPGPELSLPWQVEASLLGGTDSSITVVRYPTAWPRLVLKGPPEAAAGKTINLSLAGGEGDIELKFLRYPEIKSAEPEVTAWAEATTEDFVWAREPSTRTIGGVPVLTRTIQAKLHSKGSTIPVQLPEGRYLIQVSKRGTPAVPGQLSIMVQAKRPWLEGLTSVGLGQSLGGRLRGTKWALLTTTTENRLIDARVVKAGQALKLKVGPDWPEAVSVSIATPDGRHSTQHVDIDTSALVSIKAEEHSGAQWIQVIVKDRAGVPIRGANVLVAARSEEMAAPATLNLEPQPFGLKWRSAQIVSNASQTALATPIASGLLQERARKAERKRARQARSGAFAKNKLSGLMEEQAIMYSPNQGMGGLGSFGSGSGGGGGRGRGHSGVGTSRRGRGRHRANQPRVRQAGHWVVLKTDARGQVQTQFTPPARGKWRVVAKASSKSGRGIAQVEVDPTLTPRLQTDLPGPGAPSEWADAVFTVIAGQDGLQGKLSFDGKAIKIKMPPFQTRRIVFAHRAVGAQGQAVLSDDQGGVITRKWAFPLDRDQFAEEGQIVNIAIGPGGKPPTTWLALRPDSKSDPISLVRRGRAALAAMPSATPFEAKRLRDAAMQARLTLRHRRPSKTVELAETALFLAEGEKLLGIPSGEINAVYDALPLSDADPKVRAWLLRAWAVAGHKIESGFAERLLADIGPKDTETRAVAALALIAAGRQKDAVAIVSGAEGPFAELARARLGQAFERQGLGRVAGASGRAEWIALWAEFPPRSPRSGIVRLTADGQPLGQLDSTKGGVLSAVTNALPSTAKIPAAMVWRTVALPNTKGRPMRLKRLPKGAFDKNMVGRFVKVRDIVEVAIGDRILIRSFKFQRLPAGFVLGQDQRRTWLEATVPGEYILDGLSAGSGHERMTAVRIRVHADTVAINRYTPPTAVLALAEQALGSKQDPGPILDTQKWPRGFAGAVATKRFQWAVLSGGDELVVSTFDRVRDASPSLGLDFTQVSRVAQAFRTQGRVERAIDVWRVGLGQAFKSEAAVARRTESTAGVLVSLQGLRRITQRYPLLAPVEEALFLAPQRLGALIEEGMPRAVKEAGITPTDIRLTGAGWDREYLGLFPDSDRRAEAGFHLVELLSELGARKKAARRAAVLAKQHAKAPLLDGLLLAEGLARAALRQDDRALKLFERVASDEFALADGTTARSKSRVEARYAAARLLDARGDRKAALAGYKKVAANYPEAAAAIRSLTNVTLSVSQPVIRTTASQVEVPVRIGNLGTVQVRAYRLDLAVAFLRDAGEIDTSAIKISGVNPAWSRKIKVPSARSVRHQKISVTIDRPGAWLLQLDGGGRHTSALVIRSALRLNTRGNRLELRIHDKPAADAEIRVVHGNGQITALKTDLRGVVILPPNFKSVLAQAGEHLALHDKDPNSHDKNDNDNTRLDFKKSGQGAGRKALKRRLKKQLNQNIQQYEQNFQLNVPNAVGARML